MSTAVSTPPETQTGVPRPKRKRILLIAACLLLAFTLPLPIRVNRARVTAAIAQSLGRPVTIGSIRYRLLPWPGLTIQSFTVADDPAFSMEPVIHAENVTANIRLASLWRGRLEISRISLEDPSLNLVRNDEGHWNLESILLRASQIPSAPTARKLAEQRARFPYIEASNGRVNFRLGYEKTAFSFMDSDFALWLGAENQWNLRFSARPARTDMNLSDLGLVRANGTIQRAGSIGAAPVNLHFSWDGPQLGEASKLLSGEDRGWRGGLVATADVAGPSNDLAFTLRTGFTGFRRADILPARAFDMRAQCTGHGHYAAGSVSSLNCTLPIDGGLFAVRGSVANLHGSPRPDLRLTAESVPANSLLELARRMKRSIPDDVQAAGSLDAAFVLSEDAASQHLTPANGSATQGTPAQYRAEWKGNGILAGLRLSSDELRPVLVVGDIRFEKDVRIPLPPAKGKRRRVTDLPSLAPSPDLMLQPFGLGLGGSVPVRIDGRVSANDYSLRLQGPAEATRLLALGAALGLRPIQASVQGNIDIQASVSGRLREFAAPSVTGTATLNKVVWQTGQANAPVYFSAGTIVLTAQTALISDVAATVGNDLSVQGELGFRRGCSPITDCQFEFQLDAPTLSADALNRSFNPALAARGFKFFGGPLPSFKWLKARGTLHTGQLRVGTLSAQDASARVTIGEGRIALEDVRFESLQGEHAGDWTLDFSGSTPKFSGRGWFKRVAIADAQKLFREDWGKGTADASYSVAFTGKSPQDFVRSAQGQIDVSVRDGAWRLSQAAPQSTAPGLQTLPFSTLKMPLTLAEGALKVDNGILVNGRQTLVINGTIGPNRVLNLEFSPRGASQEPTLHARGTTEHPTITPATIAHALLR